MELAIADYEVRSNVNVPVTLPFFLESLCLFNCVSTVYTYRDIPVLHIVHCKYFSKRLPFVMGKYKNIFSHGNEQMHHL